MNGNLNKMMNKLMPMILQQEMEKQRMREQAQLYLSNRLTEYEAYDKNQRALMELGFDKDVAKEILRVIGKQSETQPYPEYSAIESSQRQFPKSAERLGLVLPENFPAMKTQAQEDTITSMVARQKIGELSPEVMRTMLGAYGYKEPSEAVGEIVKGKAEAASLAQRAVESGLVEKQIPLRELEARTHAQEVGLAKKGGKTPKELQTLLENKLNKRQTSIQKLRSLAPSDIQNVRNHEIYIDQLNNEIAGLKKTLGPENAVNQATELDKKYQPIAERFKANGCTRQMLLTDKELEKKLMAQGFSKWILLEYF